MGHFFFNDTATTEIYTLSLHDALPISGPDARGRDAGPGRAVAAPRGARRPDDAPPRPDPGRGRADGKSTRLNSSHANISYAAFCLKKKQRSPHHTTELQSRQYHVFLLL